MRVLHLAPRLSDRGGADWHLLGLLGALRATCSQTLAVGQLDISTPPGLAIEAITALGSRQATADGASRLDALVARVRPEVLHVHNVVNPAVLRWAAARGAIVTVQDHRLFCPGRGKLTMGGDRCAQLMSRSACADCFSASGAPAGQFDATGSSGGSDSYFARMYRLTADRLAAIRGCQLTVLSHYMKRELLAVGIPPASLHVIPPFVHGLELDSQADGPPCVLFAGRLARSKGVDEAVSAWRASGLKLPLLFAGTGPERARLERAGGQVLGWVPHERLGALYRRAAVLLMPSRWQEPFGIVGLEALAMGTPVAAWRSGGVEEWHPGGDGLVPWGEVTALGTAAATIAGQRARLPGGFEQATAMAQLLALYDRARGSSPGCAGSRRPALQAGRRMW